MQDHLRRRLNARAKERWPQLTRIQVRFSSGFAYVAGELPKGAYLPGEQVMRSDLGNQ